VGGESDVIPFVFERNPSPMTEGILDARKEKAEKLKAES
jgi:hypothetical protein